MSPKLYDTYDNPIAIGDRVKILCAWDDEFFDKSGIVILIGHPDTEVLFHTSYVFVQMDSGGGKWWYSRSVQCLASP